MQQEGILYGFGAIDLVRTLVSLRSGPMQCALGRGPPVLTGIIGKELALAWAPFLAKALFEALRSVKAGNRATRNDTLLLRPGDGVNTTDTTGYNANRMYWGRGSLLD